MIPSDDFTPHGYLDNPYHSWKLNPSVVVWREEATGPYQVLYEMNPRGHFVLVFPPERIDMVELIQSVQVGRRDRSEILRNRFLIPANANTALWLTEYAKCR